MTERDAFIHNPPLPKQFGDELLVIDHGEGAYLFDAAGRRYLDFGAGIAVNALGYGREEMARAAYEQMKRLVHTSNLYTSEPTIELAHRLVGLGDFEAVHFGNSGAEANEAALKYARLYSRRTKGEGHTKLLCFEGAFHGRTFGALSVTPSPKYQEPFAPLLPGVVVLPYNDPMAVVRALDRSVAGVIVEVIQGEGGLTPMTKEFAAALNEACARADAILIADEVQTGLGRLGYPFASSTVGLRPDIITLAKPLGGGLPLSATLIPAKVNQLLHVGDHGTTFGGGPVTTAVASKVLDLVLDPPFLEQVRAKAALLDGELRALARAFPFILELRGGGLLRGLAIDEARALAPAELIARAREQGLLVLRSGSNVLRIAPPLVITEDEIRAGVELLGKTFATI